MDTEQKFIISAVIPTYNSEACVSRAIDSVLAQTLPAEEILVVDDGSADQTAEAIRRYGGRVRYIHQENAGASVARNRGIQAARGEWIAFLDADDQWLPDRLRLQVRLLERHPDLQWVTGNFYRCDCARGHKQTLDMTPPQWQKALPILKDGEIFDSYFTAHRHNAMGCTDTMLIRRDLLLETGLFVPGQKRINDVDLWLRIAYRRAAMGYVFEPLAVYHLGTAGSILKAHRQAEHIDQFLQRHLRLAEEAGMAEAFRPCASAMLGWWVGQRMADGDGRQMRYLLNKHRSLFSPGSYRKQYLLSWCPRTGALYNRIKMKIQTHRRRKKAAQ